MRSADWLDDEPGNTVNSEKVRDTLPTDPAPRALTTCPFSPGVEGQDCGTWQAKGDPSDAERYRWMRAHRGNFAIFEAFSHSDRDADFDHRIVAEMRTSAAGRQSYPCGYRLGVPTPP
jgi:hypothetical protein